MTILPCRNEPETFFQPQTTRRAKRLCHDCPELVACGRAVYDIEQKLGRQEGVWAGLTEAERRRKWPAAVI